MGLEKELAYDRQLDHQRLTAGLNNDEYFEYHVRGRVYVLSDEADARLVLAGEEVPLTITRVGGGPRGETVVFGIPYAERNKKQGFGALDLYERRLEGRDGDFYAEVYRSGVYHVFDRWDDLETYRNRRYVASEAISRTLDTRTVLFASDDQTAIDRFRVLRESALPPVPAGCQCDSD